MSVRKGGGQLEKRSPFSPPNKTKPSFIRGIRGTPVEEAAANEKKEGVFCRLIRQIAFNIFSFSGAAIEEQRSRNNGHERRGPMKK